MDAAISATIAGALFETLPEQRPPEIRYTDEHVLEPCSRCGGSGREACPYPRWSYRYANWDPTCRGCKGKGRRLIFVGRAIDV